MNILRWTDRPCLKGWRRGLRICECPCCWFHPSLLALTQPRPGKSISSNGTPFPPLFLRTPCPTRGSWISHLRIPVPNQRPMGLQRLLYSSFTVPPVIHRIITPSHLHPAAYLAIMLLPTTSSRDTKRNKFEIPTTQISNRIRTRGNEATSLRSKTAVHDGIYLFVVLRVDN